MIDAITPARKQGPVKSLQQLATEQAHKICLDTFAWELLAGNISPPVKAAVLPVPSANCASNALGPAPQATPVPPFPENIDNLLGFALARAEEIEIEVRHNTAAIARVDEAVQGIVSTMQRRHIVKTHAAAYLNDYAAGDPAPYAAARAELEELRDDDDKGTSALITLTQLRAQLTQRAGHLELDREVRQDEVRQLFELSTRMHVMSMNILRNL